MIDLTFSFPERTETRDTWYGALGRALAVASEFECNCNLLAFHLGLQAQEHLLSDPAAFDKFAESASSITLGKAISTIEAKIGETRGALDRGRTARNAIAHESCFYLSEQKPENAVKYQFESWLGEAVEGVVIANFAVMVLMGEAAEICVEFPPWEEALEYPREATEWILLEKPTSHRG